MALKKFLELDPDLRAFNPQQKKNLLMLWSERGDLEEFVRAVETHPEWRSAAWRGLPRIMRRNEIFARPSN